MLKPIKDFEGRYFISDEGFVVNINTGRILRFGYDQFKYRMVILSLNNKRFARTIHRIVAENFIGPRPIGMQIDHIDGNKENNSVKNLEYVTQSENIKRAIALGLYSKKSFTNNPLGKNGYRGATPRPKLSRKFG